MKRRSENALIFMTKWPQPGTVKTRLCPPLTPVQAADFARCFLLDMLAAAARVDADCLLAYAPLAAGERFRRLVGPDVDLIPAETPSFGIALRQAQATALALGYRRVALVGSDLPHLPAERYREAFALLNTADAVVGPSADGGYYLLASSTETPALFEAIAWSTATVYRSTCTRAAEAGLRLAHLERCDDIDTAADLPSVLAALRARPAGGHTLRLLEPLLQGPQMGEALMERMHDGPDNDRSRGAALSRARRAGATA